jgi:hypothetical protein
MGKYLNEVCVSSHPKYKLRKLFNLSVNWIGLLYEDSLGKVLTNGIFKVIVEASPRAPANELGVRRHFLTG